MNSLIIYTILVSVIIGVLAAVILYMIAKTFHVEDDPRLQATLAVLPGANCAGCGYVGCRQFAEACVKSNELEKLYCPVGGNAVMTAVAKALGRTIEERPRTIAVVRCNGTRAKRPVRNVYDGPASCAIAHSLFRGETGCQYGCLWHGDCIKACQFNAMTLDAVTGLPLIREENCVACGACVKACPRRLIELRLKGPKGRRVFVSCASEDKGNIAARNCQAACIGCGKCVKTCPHNAITMVNFLANIDDEKCTLCRKCAPVCPTGAIQETGFSVPIEAA